MTGVQVHVALYSRISEDDDGDEAGVQRQQKETRAYAERQGWVVVGDYSDNDISALKGARRPGYEALLADVDAGRVQQVVVFHQSRLWRNRAERAEGIARLGNAGVGLAAVKGQVYNLGSATGRGMAGIMGEFDTMESEIKGERVASAAVERAEDGRPNGAVPYGWTRKYVLDDNGTRRFVRDELHPEQSEVVREICHRLLANESLISVTAWLNDQGIPAPGVNFKFKKKDRGLLNPDGTKWGKTSVKKIALRPQNAGLRLYHQGRPDEREFTMKADPIITVDQYRKLRAILIDPSRSELKGGARKHLLSYCKVARCGVCGAPLRAGSKQGKYGKRSYLYQCIEKGCVGRAQTPVDQLVTLVTIERLAQLDVRSLLTASDDNKAKEALERVAALESRLTQAADEFADGNIDVIAHRRINARLRPQIEEARREAELAAPTVPVELLSQTAGHAAAERWSVLTVVQRQAIIEALFESIVLLRRTKKGPGFEPETVQFTFKGMSEPVKLEPSEPTG